MDKAGLSKLVAVPLVCGGLALAACGSSGSAKAGGSAGPTTTLPTLSASPATLALYLNSRQQASYTADGKPVTDPNQAPAVGDYFTDSDIIYRGTHAQHDKVSIGSAHLLCAITSISGNTAAGVCNGFLDLGGSLMVADHQAVQLGQNANIALSITGGTGRYQGAQGKLASTSVPDSNDTDLTITVSRPGGAAGTTPSGTDFPSLTSTAQDYHLYSRSTQSLEFGPDGKAITDPNAPPAVGDWFATSDENYVGNHSSHGKAVVGTDHLVCAFTAIEASGQSGTAVCDGAITFGNSMVVVEHRSVGFSGNQNPTVPITNGTGRYQGAHGTVHSTSIGSTDNSDVTLTLSK